MKKILYVGLTPPSPKEGEEVIHLPLIQIVPRSLMDRHVREALKRFSDYTHVIITSKNTAKILAQLLLEGEYSLQEWGQKKSLAIGQATGDCLMELGIQPTLIAQEETSEGIVKELEALSLSQSFIFWPHAAGSRSVIADYLQDKKIVFKEVILYDTLPLLPLTKPSLVGIDEIIFTSPSTVAAFVQLFGTLPQEVKLTPIGPITETCLINALHSQ